MPNLSITAQLDLASLQTLQGFANYGRMLEPELLKAMDRGLAILQSGATDYMYANFKQPTGQAESAWEASVQSPYLAILGNTAPYAQRLEFGFSGMTDALGRFYPYWPDYHWAENTVEQDKDLVAAQFQAAIDYANLSLGRGVP